MSERPTLRPVTIGRLVEVVDLSRKSKISTREVADSLGVTSRRAREVLQEANRIGLVEQSQSGQSDVYSQSPVGSKFIQSVLSEKWSQASRILEENSPHYDACLKGIRSEGPIRSQELINHLNDINDEYSFNETGMTISLNWAERLDSVQRNAFSGHYYQAKKGLNTDQLLRGTITTYHELDESTGIGLRQKFVSIPRLREYTCQRTKSPRDLFNSGLRKLASANVGRVELTGAPLDTGAKEAEFSVKQIELDGTGAAISTEQSTDPIQSGVKIASKQHYYIAIHANDNEIVIPK